jgi:chemotaxis protein methyltransferase CheR
MDDLPADREFRFTTQDFERVRSMIHARAGISLAPSKKTMVYSRLSRRLRELGVRDFESYLALLQSDDSGEWAGFVNALTTNLTSFFREPYHFPILADHLRRCAERRRDIRIWCTAASTGEEPYSIAMTAVEALGERPPVSILASDIDTRVLATARAGIYPLAGVEVLGEARLRRFLLRGRGPREGYARIRPELAALVEFRQLNLVDLPAQVGGPFDAIFCRNVLIYFDAGTKQRVVENLRDQLRPDGLLFVGHSENFAGARNGFRPEGKTVYRRMAPAVTSP